MLISEEITLRKLEIFLAFMQYGNLGEAAHATDNSTVSVHRALHSLESGLRCPLFKRQGRMLVPLSTAYVFAEHAAKVVSECSLGIEKTQEAAGFKATRLVIGSAYSLTVRTIPQLLFGLKSRRPQLGLDLNLGSTRELAEKLRKGDISVALVATVSDEAFSDDFVSLELFTDEVCFAAPLNSRYSDRDEIDLDKAKAEKFVSLNQDFHTVQSQKAIFHMAGFDPNVVMRAANLFALANLVADGIGFGLLPRRVALFTSKVQLIPLSAKYRTWQKIVLLIPKLRERDPNLLAIAAECRLIQH
ncbi:LysR family transcriptional regulator [Candidimonas humi]|uniref:LysR substrate-binding domain-containing protein n=1 Tax=Candidimonas humi TaxID=683355 RepID=A0ABV8NWX0_9BURK|nr:LysR substrate-binding domain-containing protein [Candidimonas humi]MBV6304049.1 LysR family transcriptional regulator [Candidimonas humi]